MIAGLHKSKFLIKSANASAFFFGFFCLFLIFFHVCVYVLKWFLLAMLMGFISLVQDNQMAANTAQQLHFCFTGNYVFLALLPTHTVTIAGSSGGSGARLGLIGTLYLT